MTSILISGDFMPRGRVAELIEKGDYATSFSELKALNSQADYAIINFECTVADESDSPIRKYGPNLKCSSKSLEAIRWAGYDMVTLANNHFYDFGDSGIKKSFEAIEANSLDYVGAGYNSSDAAKVFYKEINGGHFAFINCCENEFSVATDTHGGCNALNPIKQFYSISEAKLKADYIIVIVHGGHEHLQLPSPRMKEIYRFFIDAGADAVINHHQHCYSGFEYYKNRPIVYGLGNICFDLGVVSNKRWNEGFVARLIFDNDTITLATHPYIQCSEEPKIHFLEDNTAFQKKINKLNDIIADDNLLRQSVEQFYLSSKRALLAAFEPYNNRYFKAAWYRHLIPSTFRGLRVRQIQNYIMCESHLDRLRCIIADKLRNN